MGGFAVYQRGYCYNGPMINVSETAAGKINELLSEENKAGSGLRVFVQGGGCSGFQYGLMIEENGQGSGDQVFESHGVKLVIDPISIRYLHRPEVDFVRPATVRRSVPRKRRERVARDADFADARPRFAPALRHPPHFHLVSTTCHRPSQFLSPDVQALMEEIATARNFSAARSVGQIVDI